MAYLQVHRFGDTVALHAGGGETVYLSVRDARLFSGAINRTCRSVERETFVDSTCGTFSHHAVDGRQLERKRQGWENA